MYKTDRKQNVLLQRLVYWLTTSKQKLASNEAVSTIDVVDEVYVYWTSLAIGSRNNWSVTA